MPPEQLTGFLRGASRLRARVEDLVAAVSEAEPPARARLGLLRGGGGGFGGCRNGRGGAELCCGAGARLGGICSWKATVKVRTGVWIPLGLYFILRLSGVLSVA